MGFALASWAGSQPATPQVVVLDVDVDGKTSFSLPFEVLVDETGDKLVNLRLNGIEFTEGTAFTATVGNDSTAIEWTDGSLTLEMSDELIAYATPTRSYEWKDTGPNGSTSIQVTLLISADGQTEFTVIDEVAEQGGRLQIELQLNKFAYALGTDFTAVVVGPNTEVEWINPNITLTTTDTLVASYIPA